MPGDFDRLSPRISTSSIQGFDRDRVQELASGGAKLTNIAPNPDASQGRALACPKAGVLVYLMSSIGLRKNQVFEPPKIRVSLIDISSNDGIIVV